MADRALFITWGENVHGREERGLEVFNEAVGFYGRCQQEGRIERFDVCLLEPTGTDVQGFIAVYGTEEQLAALKADEEYQRNLIDASMIIKRLSVVDGWTGDGIARQMAMYMEAIQKVPQHT
jgi:hypothetical protein